MIFQQHRLFRRVHAADLRAVALAAAGHITGTDALDKHDVLRVLSVGQTHHVAAGRARRIHQTFQLQRCDDVFALVVVIFIKLVKADGVKAGGYDDRTIFSGDDLILLRVVDGSGRADLGTDSAFSGLKLNTCIRVDHRYVGNRLGKRRIDR